MQQQQQQALPYNSARLTIGDVVLISDPSEGIGVVRHIDELSFIVGIELTDPLGTCDGVRDNERYFKCRPKYGIFVSVSDIVRLVSPEELLHKIVVLNRALAHKHSTLTAKNQIIDKLKKEIISLQQSLSINIANQQNLNNEINKLKNNKRENTILLDAPTNHSIDLTYNDIDRLNVAQNQTLNRPSKPQTPHDNTSDDDGNNDNDTEHHHQKPRSRPPSRRGSLLNGNDTINLELKRKLNEDLSNYLTKYKNKHSRDTINHSMSPISSHHSTTSLHSNHSSHSISKHRKQRSTVEEAAKKLRKEIKAKQMIYHDEDEDDNQDKDKDKEGENEDDDHELLSDEYFVEMSNKYKNNSFHKHPKRLSRSQPTSPRHYFNGEFNYNNTDNEALKSSSVWRKNREAFLKQMDKKLEEVMHKFELKQIPRRPISAAFHSKPLVRKRGYSYHENSYEMQEVIRQNKDKQSAHKASFSSTALNNKYEWLTTKTTFSKYNDRLNKEEEEEEEEEKKRNMIARRSISLPSSPKHRDHISANFVDTLDLGDEENGCDDDCDDDCDDENEHDVLEDNNDEDNDDDHPDNLYVVRKESEPIRYDRSIQKRRRHRERLKAANRFKKRNRYNDETENNNEKEDPEEEEEETYYRMRRIQRRKRYQKEETQISDSEEETQIIDCDKDEYVDMDQEQYKYYETKKRNSKIHLFEKDEFEKEYNSILQ